MLADICELTHLRMFEVSRTEDWDFADLHALVRCFRPDMLVYSNAEIGQVKTLGRLRGFHVVRDPRDLIVSAYYSHFHSHSLETWPGLAEHRKRLQATDKSAGLLLEMDFSRRVLADIGDWDYAQPDVLELRMEDLIASPSVYVSKIVEHLGLTHLPPSTYGERLGGLIGILFSRIQRLMRRRLPRLVAPPSTGPQATNIRAAKRAAGPDPYRYYPLDMSWRHGLRPRSLALEDVPIIVVRHSFANKAGGRDRGVEDAHNHYRKGLAGDWRNHFEPIHIDYFKRNYNRMLLSLGYEADPHWG